MNKPPIETAVRYHRKGAGFTLIELMIVVVIVAILAAIAYPAYRGQMVRSNRTEGKAIAMDAAARQERFFSDNNTYTTDMTALNFPANPAVSANGYYQVSAAAGATGIATSFVITATAQGAQAADDGACVNLTVDNLGQRLPAADCW